jgi:tryptophan-rich hypothetical protein
MTRPALNALSPKKLLRTKWTAVEPRHKEKHFLVTKIIEPEPPGSPVVSVEIEAVYSKRAQIIEWRELTDAARWRCGWVATPAIRAEPSDALVEGTDHRDDGSRATQSAVTISEA